MTGSHTVKMQRRRQRGARSIEFLQRTGRRDRVLAPISGDGTAPMVAPEREISLANCAQINEVLLASVHGFEAGNLVRQRIDGSMGGGLLDPVAPVEVDGFILRVSSAMTCASSPQN